MLSSEEIKEIEHAIKLVPHKKAASVEALKVIQEHRRWVSDESLRDVAKMLDVSPEELDSVATFYNMIFRKEVGKHVILVCDSISCFLTGYDDLIAAIKHDLNIDYGQTTADGRFTLLPICCLGNCDKGPTLMIDDDTHGPVTRTQVATLLEQYR